ncbi:hypothetical protein [uncultured Leifsonia sp.]|uniref:hypothetical protein n=1 Tax=uncultured Leifsonia sp. TaxID=340359 RepID=UPI0028D90E33|nr:hypothetical protein [uncultured Leifsonia sp.]
MTETHTIRPAAATSRRALFRPILVLLWCFLTVSAAMIAFLAVLASVGVGVDIAVWIRSSFVLASSVVLLLLGVFAARGSRASWVRLRIITPIVVLAVVVIVAIPGFLPDWVRVEQAVCGALVLPVAILANLPRAGSAFRRDA